MNKIKKDIISTFSESCIKIIIFGSYARGEETSDSDLDVCFVYKNKMEEAILRKLERYETSFYEKYICHFSGYKVNQEEFKKEKLPLIKEIKKYGEVIYG